MNVDVRELRTGTRYLVLDPMVGSFGSVSVAVLNLAEQGLQIEHAQPIRLGTSARVWMKSGNNSVAVNGITIWSRLSKNPNHEGKYLYRSGVRVESSTAELVQLINVLVRDGRIRADDESLDRKRQSVVAKQVERQSKPTVRIISEHIDSDVVLLVEHARNRLRANPEEAKRWYNRARFVASEDRAKIADDAHHREDVLAVWEYLERSIDLSTIIKIFDR